MEAESEAEVEAGFCLLMYLFYLLYFAYLFYFTCLLYFTGSRRTLIQVCYPLRKKKCERLRTEDGRLKADS